MSRLSKDWTRRRFLQGVGIGSATLAFGGLPTRLAFANPTQREGRDALVFVSLSGGWDGLSAVVPAFEAAYYDARPTIAIAESQLLDLDGRFGLHPGLAGLADLYADGQLAVVNAVGGPNPTRSHFSARDAIDAGAANPRDVEGGWLARHLLQRGSSESVFQAVAVGSVLPTSLRGAPAFVTSALRNVRLSTHWREGARFESALRSLSAEGERFSGAARRTLEAIDAAREITSMPSGVEYPQGSFARALREIAQLLRADAGLEIATVDIGGWDTHSQQGDGSGGRMNDSLRLLGNSLRAFADDLGGVFERVTVVVQSEFGRRLAENGSWGTDHGRAAPMLLLGGGVLGGVYGDWPGLDADSLDRGDLAMTTDYRDVLAEVAEKRLANPHSDQLFPGLAPAPLGVVRPAA